MTIKKNELSLALFHWMLCVTKKLELPTFILYYKKQFYYG